MNRKLNFEKFLIAALLLVAVGILFWAFKGKKPETKQQNNQESKQEQQPNLIPAINGVLLDPSKVQRPFAVIIENHPDARPQSGLSQADIVYEALAEGGITRYMAVYQTQDVAKIGPVRSARTYFNDWAQELCAIYVHVGGNSDALTYIKNGIPCVSDADQFFNDPYFLRISSRKPPHNTYTSVEKLIELAKAHNYDMAPSYESLSFKDDQPEATPSAGTIKLNFSTPSFAVSYKYDPATNSYKRSISGALQVDAGNNAPVQPKVVIAQTVRNWPVESDTPFSISMGTREGGKAVVFQDGKKTNGTWRVVNGRTKYYDGSGKEITLNRGQIWIEIVPPDGAVSSGQ